MKEGRRPHPPAPFFPIEAALDERLGRWRAPLREAAARAAAAAPGNTAPAAAAPAANGKPANGKPARGEQRRPAADHPWRRYRIGRAAARWEPR